ncbi:MAG: outer membrane lipoprotein-sorting protein [Deltaproteobacteria bacterium]|nr:outer membrane lipoprotein-sorting protein [Deltaproteobacteria bacterium]
MMRHALTALASLAVLGSARVAYADDVPAAPPAPAALPAPAAQPAPAAKLSAQEILDKMDRTNNGFTDQTMEMALTVRDVDGSKKTYEFTMHQKGDAKRLLLFSSGEMKGMATLVEDRNSVYVYLPGFKKVRRVTANTMSQGFAGSDMTNDDMAITAWGKGWTPTLEKEDETGYWVSLTPKPEEKTDYTRVIHKIDKGHFGQMETHYFKGKELVKKLVCSKNQDFGNGVRHNMHVEVTDPRTGHATIMETKAFRFNQGLKDDLFTVRQLQWGK